MRPKILENDAEYREAQIHVEKLRGLEAGPDRESDLKLWSFLLRQYEESGLRVNPPAGESQTGLMGKLRAPPRADLWWPRFSPPLKISTWLFFVGTALLLYLRLMYHVSFFPPFWEGEEAKVLDLARDTCDYAAYTHSWWEAIRGGLVEYNKGFTLLLVPFYFALGYDVRIIMYVIPAVYCILLPAFFTIYRKTYPKSSLLSFVVVIMFSMLCLALRRYKWHPVIYVTAIATYLYFLPEFYSGAFFLRDRWRKLLAVILWALSCYFYFGCLIYGVPILILIFFFSTKAQRRRELAYGCMGLAVFAAVFALVYQSSYMKQRVWDELTSIRQDFAPGGLIKVWGPLRDLLFTLDLTVPYLVIYGVGLFASFRRIRSGDRFALINTTLYFSIFPFLLAVGGLNNPDQTNWLMIPFLGILLIGADEILCALRDRVRHGTFLGVLIVLCLGWNEMRHYLPLTNDTPYETGVLDRNTRTQVALVLRMIRDDESGSVQYYLPAPSVPQQDGGFEYTASLPRVDYAKAFLKVIYFMNEGDLRRKLLLQRGGRKAVVFLSVGFPGPGEKDTINMPLLGKDPEIIHPFEEVYGAPFLVRRFEFATGKAAAALPQATGQ
ncbi:MAG: hypothetical protein WCA95_04485 [Opitutaceae bacterium]|jgi:hypothetical protein